MGHRGKGKARSSGIMWAVAGPVGLVALVVLAIIGVGAFGFGKSKPPGTAQAPAPAAPTTPVQSQSPAASQPEPEPPKPPEPKEDNRAIVEARRHIDRSAGAKETMLLTLYFADGLTGGTTLQPVEVRIPATRTTIRATVEQVLNAPADLKLYSSAPAGTTVRSVSLDTKTGVATVDLTPEVSKLQGSAAAQTLMASLVYSLTAIKDVKSVQLWSGGRPAVIHGIEWARPLSRADMEGRNYFQVTSVIKFSP